MAVAKKAKIKGLSSNHRGLPFAVHVIDNENEWRGSSVEPEINVILKNLEVPLYAEDLVNAFPDPKLKIGTTITIKRAPVIYLQDGATPLVVRSWTKTVSEFLKDKGILLGPMDRIQPSVETKIKSGDSIYITRIGEREEKIEEVIGYQKIEKLTPNLYIGEEELEQRGKNGKIIKTFRLRYENNVLVSRGLVNEEVIIKMVPEVMLIGTRPKITVRCRYNDTVEQAAVKYGVDANSLCRTMMCESNGNADSFNPIGPYYGLYQYTQGLWGLLSPKAGYGGMNIFNPTAQIYTTAWAWSHGYRGRWPNC